MSEKRREGAAEGKADWAGEGTHEGTRESTLHLLLDTRRARKQGAGAIARRQRDRLAELVALARAHSPYYREHYRDVRADAHDPAHLPVTGKVALMARFDEWTTDRAVTLDRVRAFVDRPDLIGERFLGRYTVVTTSGTTGSPGSSCSTPGPWPSRAPSRRACWARGSARGRSDVSSRAAGGWRW